MGKGGESFGEYTMRIPEQDYRTLMVLLPDLQAQNAEVREAAWKQFAESPLANAYRMARSPQQVRRSNKHKIIIN